MRNLYEEKADAEQKYRDMLANEPQFVTGLSGALGKRYEDCATQACDSTADPGSQEIRQLSQLLVPVWDGNLMSKSMRDHLVKTGLVDRAMGWNFLTAKGVEYCVTLRLLRS